MKGKGDRMLGRQSTDLLAIKPFPGNRKAKGFVLCPDISCMDYRGQYWLSTQCIC